VNAAQARRVGILVHAFNKSTADGHACCTFLIGERHTDGRDNRCVELILGTNAGAKWMRMLPIEVAQITIHKVETLTAVEVLKEINAARKRLEDEAHKKREEYFAKLRARRGDTEYRP